MKRSIFICVALISFLATNASGTNFHKSDQLQTFLVKQHPIVIMPAMHVTLEPAMTVYNFTKSTVPAENQMKQTAFKLDAWRNPEYGPSLVVLVSNKFISTFDAVYSKIPIPIPIRAANKKTDSNYNINYSYGLRS